nr:uncharacterized protein LOC109174202 [Ipomoea batatas]
MLYHQQQVAPSCINKYPRSFNDETTFDENSYPIYRRMDTSAYVVVRGHQLDNRWVVPYNPYLLAKFDCHINVEVCVRIRCVKYIHKYIYKDHDRISLSLYAGADVHEYDEIKEYQSVRWVSPPEAAWRIYAFPISEVKPADVHLQVHLQNYQYINFHGNDRTRLHNDDEVQLMVLQLIANTVEKMVKKIDGFNLVDNRSRKWIALPTASSGIAASILPGGRTAHSTFKIPIDGDDKTLHRLPLPLDELRTATTTTSKGDHDGLVTPGVAATVKVAVFSPLSAVNSDQLGGSPRPFPNSTVIATGDDEGA